VSAPDLLDALINRGREDALRQALALRPDEPSAWFNLGILHGRRPEAAQAYRRSLALEPAVDAAANLADVLRDSDPLIAAIPFYRRALALEPAHLSLIESLAFSLSYDPDATSGEIFALNRRWGALLARPRVQPAAEDGPLAHPIDPSRRLRVGYLSADLHEHPIGRNLVGLIEHHSEAVELFFYAGREVDDRIVRRLKARAAAWRTTVGLDDADLAERIRADRLDLLVFLAGHTPFNRLGLAAHRPAPVQIAMHDLTTSGLPEIDAVLGDEATMPEGGEEGFVERILRLPSFYLHERLPAVPLAPRPLIGAEGPLTLVSANNPAKLNDRVVDLWAEILARLPQARLLLKYRDRFGDPLIQARWLKRLKRRGLGPERLLFRTGDEDLSSHLAVIGAADIALDPFPFNGATTTYEALWMGVPVVTWKGRRFVGRTAAAMLETLGLSELVAANETEYLAAVLALAQDPRRRADLRSSLRARLEASSLLDAPAYARAVEAEYRRLREDKSRA
jgi:predicted O-linked N-acetylglucosamine transferase (SPINDLY family)